MIWHWTDDLAISNRYNYSWRGADNNRYTARDLRDLVEAETLDVSDAFWLIPANSNSNVQPEVLLNENTSSDCCPTPPSITTTVNQATSGNNGELIIDSASNAQFYGISSLNANSYDGPTTIVTATPIPNSLPANILANAAGGTYIVRIFNNIDGCFTDVTLNTISGNNNNNNNNCSITKTHVGGCWTTEVVSVTPNNGKFDIEILVTYTGNGGCKELSHFSVEADDNSFSNVSWNPVSGDVDGEIALSLGNNDPFDGFKLDDVSDIGDGEAGSFMITYTLNYLQDQQFLAKAGNDYSQIASFTVAEFQSILDCSSPQCDTAENNTTTASITENETKDLVGSPAGGTWSIIAGGGTINGTTYTPDDINTNTDVTIRYTIAADGSCSESTADVTFTVTPVCIVAENNTTTASISENETKDLVGSPVGGTWSIIAGGGTINGTTYTPDNINTNTDVTIRYTIAADGSCSESTADVTFTVTPVCVVAENNTTTASITENETKDLVGSPAGGAWSIISGGGTINGTTYTPDNINTNTDVTIRYTIAADGSCSESTADVTFTVTPIIQLGSIGDTVWFDTDGDGILDAGEPGLENATVTLDPGTPNDASDDQVMLTDANGNYLFENLPAGNYTVSVDINTVTGGIPAGKTIADLIQTFDADGLGSAHTSSLTLAQGEDNLDQDFAYNVPTGVTTGGNDGGIESESLGDALSKVYIGRKKNSIPTKFVKNKTNIYNKAKLQAAQPYQGKGQTMLDMFPAELYAGDVANVTSPTDILDYTIADEVLSVDFSLNGETKGVVLGIKTSDRVYNHTKASCDRLRGAEILNVMPLEVKGYQFLMQALKQRGGEIEYAVSFAASKNNNDANYTIQTKWYVNNYTQFNDMYNFQVWTTNPADTKKLVGDIIDNLTGYIPVEQEDTLVEVPETYASKIYRDKADLIIKLRSTQEGETAEVSMVELYSETANNIKHRHNAIATQIQQTMKVAIADGYEYDGTIEVAEDIQDAFYHADGNWGLDFDRRYTEIQEYFVYNNFDREYRDNEHPFSRDLVLKATSDYDYLTLYKSLLPGTLDADYTEYQYLAFTAKGSGLMELGLVKKSIQDWKEQYRVMVDLSEEEQTYYVPFEIFSSTGTQEKIVADDLTTITFTWLPVEANNTELDLEISDVRFTKEAVEEQTVDKIETFENEFMTYPNPSNGAVNVMLFSETDTKATVTLSDVTGKTIYRGELNLTTGKNEFDFDFNVKPGLLFLEIASDQTSYGTSKILCR